MSKYPLSFLTLSFILLFGFLIRVYNVGQIPAGFFCDEAAIGYNAYKLLATGKDEYGVFLPFFFQSFGDYRLPVPIYSTIPFVAFFGLNEFSVRLTAAVFGTFTVYLVYLITKRLFRNQTASLFAAFFLAISPWHIHFSRFGSEYIYFPFWFCLALYLFLKGIENKIYFVFAALAFGVTLYTYYPALFIVPVFIFCLSTIFRRYILQKHMMFPVGIVFLICLIPFLLGIQQGTILTRWNNVNVFNNNSYLYVIKNMTSTYANHFSPVFLFEKGDIGFPGHFITRFSVLNFGELYWIQLPLLLLGILYLIRQKTKRKEAFVLLLWFILYPLGSTVTGTDGGGPFAFRSIFGVVPFQILSALGVLYLITYFRSKVSLYIILCCITIVFIISSAAYLKHYYTLYPRYSSNFWGWQFGPRDIMKYFLQKRHNYQDLIIVGNFNAPQIFIPFYDPQNTCQDKCRIGEISDFNSDRKQLFAIGADRMSDIKTYDFIIKKLIYYPNGDPAFYVGTLALRKN